MAKIWIGTWGILMVKIPGDPELVMILLRGGAEHLRSSASGQTALDFARTEEVPGWWGRSSRLVVGELNNYY